jgi:hypothetical protein
VPVPLWAHSYILNGVTDDDHQSPEELEAHYGTGGPVDAALRWIELVREGELERAWPLTESRLRLVLVQAWLWANRSHPLIKGSDLDEAAAALARQVSPHPLWHHFLRSQQSEFDDKWADFDLAYWGAGSRPRIIAPDLELIICIRTGGEPIVFEEATLLDNARLFLMHSGPEGWLVASFEDVLPEPGWPPKSGRPD